MKLIMLICSWH